jgi:hypothetical protein
MRPASARVFMAYSIDDGTGGLEEIQTPLDRISDVHGVSPKPLVWGGSPSLKDDEEDDGRAQAQHCHNRPGHNPFRAVQVEASTTGSAACTVWEP